MIPNLHDYKIITIPCEDYLGINLKTTYTEPNYSIFNFSFDGNSNLQRFPIVCKIDENSEAFKKGLRKGHNITKLNGHSLEYKDVNTLLSDFLYEKKIHNHLKLTFF